MTSPDSHLEQQFEDMVSGDPLDEDFDYGYDPLITLYCDYCGEELDEYGECLYCTEQAPHCPHCDVPLVHYRLEPHKTQGEVHDQIRDRESFIEALNDTRALWGDNRRGY